MRYGRLYLFCRWVVRVFTPSYRVVNPENLEEPAVYVCKHSDLQGIFMTMPWLPVPVRLWGLHVFGEAKACYEHLRNITFMGRYGWPKWKATLVAKLSAIGLSALYRSARVIPVYRGSGQAIKTFRMSVEALLQGESLLIFPDKDYASQDAEVSDLYEGFLSLDRFYYKKTQKHIPFIPLSGDRVQRTLTVHAPLRFQHVGDKQEVKEMVRLLKERLSGNPGEVCAPAAE